MIKIERIVVLVFAWIGIVASGIVIGWVVYHITKLFR